ncbi:MAG: hypothetical protein NTY38_10370, partial [Acidobacteria bacterium]|nr:hypothetical protein [Acidobacteriota bacterium]
MSARKPDYRRLPGRRQGILFGAGLWLADDHLLSIQSWRFREEYRRYSLREIQSITVTRRHSFVVASWQVWSLVVLFVAAVFLMRVSANALWWWLAVAGAMFVWWLVAALNLSCRVTLKTAVSTVTLKSLYRVRAARRFLAAIEPGIAAAQGMLPENWTNLEVPPDVVSAAPGGAPAGDAPEGASSPVWTVLPAVM